LAALFGLRCLSLKGIFILLFYLLFCEAVFEDVSGCGFRGAKKGGLIGKIAEWNGAILSFCNRSLPFELRTGRGNVRIAEKDFFGESLVRYTTYI